VAGFLFVSAGNEALAFLKSSPGWRQAQVINEILKSLKALGAVTSQRESTGGREATRWSMRSQ
jgi:hypothetical protein